MKFQFTPINANVAPPGHERSSHFFLTSVAEWVVDTDLEAAISAMKKHGLTFSLWHVPLPLDATYRIKEYAPQVEGAVLLGAFKAQDQ